MLTLELTLHPKIYNTAFCYTVNSIKKSLRIKLVTNLVNSETNGKKEQLPNDYFPHIPFSLEVGQKQVAKDNNKGNKSYKKGRCSCDISTVIK